jgi:hypothetical protein
VLILPGKCLALSQRRNTGSCSCLRESDAEAPLALNVSNPEVVVGKRPHRHILRDPRNFTATPWNGQWLAKRTDTLGACTSAGLAASGSPSSTFVTPTPRRPWPIPHFVAFTAAVALLLALSCQCSYPLPITHYPPAYLRFPHSWLLVLSALNTEATTFIPFNPAVHAHLRSLVAAPRKTQVFVTSPTSP